MSDLAWFRLLLRAIGLYVMIQMSAYLIEYTGYLVRAVQLGTWADPSSTMLISSTLGYLLAVCVGLYLLLGGEWVMRLCVRDLVVRCAVCGYPLSKIVGTVCPECGVPCQQADRDSAEDGAPAHADEPSAENEKT